MPKQVSVVVGPIQVRDVLKAAELLAALRAVREGALSEGRVSEYDLYRTNINGVVCNEKNTDGLVCNEQGPYFLREVYPTKEAQDAHNKDSDALGAFRITKGVLADCNNPNRAVDILRTTVTEGEAISEEEFLASVNTTAAAAAAPLELAKLESNSMTTDEQPSFVLKAAAELEAAAGDLKMQLATQTDKVQTLLSELETNDMQNKATVDELNEKVLQQQKIVEQLHAKEAENTVAELGRQKQAKLVSDGTLAKAQSKWAVADQQHRKLHTWNTKKLKQTDAQVQALREQLHSNKGKIELIDQVSQHQVLDLEAEALKKEIDELQKQQVEELEIQAQSSDKCGKSCADAKVAVKQLHARLVKLLGDRIEEREEADTLRKDTSTTILEAEMESLEKECEQLRKRPSGTTDAGVVHSDRSSSPSPSIAANNRSKKAAPPPPLSELEAQIAHLTIQNAMLTQQAARSGPEVQRRDGVRQNNVRKSQDAQEGRRALSPQQLREKNDDLETAVVGEPVVGAPGMFYTRNPKTGEMYAATLVRNAGISGLNSSALQKSDSVNFAPRI